MLGFQKNLLELLSRNVPLVMRDSDVVQELGSREESKGRGKDLALESLKNQVGHICRIARSLSVRSQH